MAVPTPKGTAIVSDASEVNIVPYIAVNAPYLSFTGSQFDVIKNLRPYLSIDSIDPINMTVNITNRITPTIEAKAIASFLKPSSTNLSEAFLCLRLKALGWPFDTTQQASTENLNLDRAFLDKDRGLGGDYDKKGLDLLFEGVTVGIQ